MSEKQCPTCGEFYPETAEFFHKDGDSFRPVCKTCRNIDKKRKKYELAVSKTANIEERILAKLNSSTGGGANIPHTAELVEAICEVFGGVKGLADACLSTYLAADPGGSHRVKLLTAFIQLVAKNAEQGGAKKPLSVWDESELSDEIERRLTTLLDARQMVALEHEPAYDE